MAADRDRCDDESHTLQLYPRTVARYAYTAITTIHLHYFGGRAAQPAAISHAAATTAFSPPHFEPLSIDFVGSLKQLLRSYIQAPDLDIEFTAAVCDASKRSLQRKLTESGTCYSEVLDQVRFHEASRLLQDSAMKVADVSHRLGYSDPTHFSRAFRRIAGVNPQVYRRQYRH